jgi:hypothetical protein
VQDIKSSLERYVLDNKNQKGFHCNGDLVTVLRSSKDSLVRDVAKVKAARSGSDVGSSSSGAETAKALALAAAAKVFEEEACQPNESVPHTQLNTQLQLVDDPAVDLAAAEHAIAVAAAAEHANAVAAAAKHANALEEARKKQRSTWANARAAKATAAGNVATSTSSSIANSNKLL